MRWIDAAGKESGVFAKAADYRSPILSHDGRRVASSIADSGSGRLDIWVDDLQRGASTRLTFDAANEFTPQWSPDDSKVVYSSDAKGAGDLMIKDSSGTGVEEVLYASPYLKIPSDWSRDGKAILFSEQSPKMSFDVWMYSLENHKATVLLQTPFQETNGRFSPDGRWLLYQTDESGRTEVYVMSLSGKRGKWQISTGGASRPRWSADGKRIYYVSPDFKLMAVDVAPGRDDFVAGTPRVLFPVNMKRINGTQYDFSADGKRILVNTPMEQTEIAPLTLVQNWTSALKK